MLIQEHGAVELILLSNHFSNVLQVYHAENGRFLQEWPLFRYAAINTLAFTCQRQLQLPRTASDYLHEQYAERVDVEWLSDWLFEVNDV